MMSEAAVAVRSANATTAIAAVNRWSRVVSHLFFCFFASPILSPAINDKAIYLFWIIPIFDPEFLKYLHRLGSRVHAHFVVATGAYLVWLLAVSPELALRWAFILWPLSYLNFTYESKMFYLYFWIGVNVFVCLAQALAYLVGGSGAAMLIGPTNISQVIWGQYATRTLTNFYSIVPGIDFPRFSGLSREGGFFAALLATVLLAKKTDRQPVGWVLWTGVALSLSKATVFAALGWLVVLAGLKDRRSPAVLFLPLFLAFILLYYLFVDNSLMSGRLSGTFTHRLYAYGAIFHDMDVANLLVGNIASPTVLVQFKSFQICSLLAGYLTCLDTPSFAALVFSTGFIGLCLYIWQLSAMGIRLWGVLLIFVLSSNVFPLTNMSFVVLSYFLALRLAEERTLEPAERAPASAAEPPQHLS